MPTFRHGKNTNFCIADSGGVSRDISNVLKDSNFPRPVDTVETTAFTVAAKEYVVGLPSATFSVSGMFDLTVDGYLNGILGFDTARAFIYGPEGTTATRRKYTGSAYETNYNTTTSVSDVVGFTADFQVTGAVTVGVYP